jgi:hypothetical protein
VLAASERIGGRIKRQVGSHKLLAREGWPDYEFAFHDRDELGRRILSRIAKHTALRPQDLWTTWLAKGNAPLQSALISV